MKVILSRSCLVQPAEPTWNGRMPLSEYDQIGFVTHVPTIYFYKNSQSTPIIDTVTIFTTLKTSLSKVLVHFYPLAGRLTWSDGSRIEVDCNGKGVQLIEASCIDAKLDDLGDFTPSSAFEHLIPEINYKVDPIEEIPLLIVQLTKFSCGGLALSCTISHALADGQSVYQFLAEWARVTRGEPLGTPPQLDRKVLCTGDPLPPLGPQPHFQHDLCASQPQLIGQSSSNNESQSNKVATVAMFKLSKFQMEMLKNEANINRISRGTGGRAYTIHESIVGHIWRCACKARGHAYEQPTALGIGVDIRKRVQPQLPENYFGNAVEYVIVTELSGELVARPLGYAVGKIQEVVDKVTSEYVHSSIDFVKNLKDLSGLQDIHAMRKDQYWAFYGNPNIGVLNWADLPAHGLDFGWGGEIFSVPVMRDGDGDSVILPGYDQDGSLIVALCLESQCMEDFKKYFYHMRRSNL